MIYQSVCSCKGSGPGLFPITPGVWSSNNPSPDCNLAAFKMAFNLAGLAAGIQASVNGNINDTSGCVPLAVNFTDTLAMGKTYTWDFNDGSPLLATSNPTVSHTFNTVGLYRIRLTSIDSTTCNIADTSFVTLRVRNDKAGLAFTTSKLPPCASLSYQFTNNSVAIKTLYGKQFSMGFWRWEYTIGRFRQCYTYVFSTWHI